MVGVEEGGFVFFDVIVRPQTWRNVAYGLLAFPLGIFYFVMLVTGFSLGIGLAIVIVGLPILLAVMLAAYGLGDFERALTNMLLGQDTPPASRLAAGQGFWATIGSLITGSETWKRVLYLLVEFPFGVITFSLVVTSGSMFALAATPLLYEQSWWPTYDWPTGLWAIDSLGEAFLYAAGGVLAGFLLLHVLNGVTELWGRFASAMLGPTHRTPVVEQPRQTVSA